MSEHLNVREALEIAAVEPAGLDRLEAGDTAEAAMVAGHLAGCPDCLEELARLRRAETLLRPIVAEAPDPALRDRTLAFVRSIGVPRGADAPAIARGGIAADGAPPSAVAPASAEAPGAADGPRPVAAAADGSASARPPAVPRRRRTPAWPAWAASLAAALVIGLVGGALIVGQGGPSGNADPAAALDRVAREIAALEAAGDAREIVLVDAAGAPAGMMVLSPSAGRLVVTAAGLAGPPAGAEHRCWVEVGGERRVIGSMWRAGDTSWWAGDVALPPTLPPGLLYGVSVVPVDGSGPGSVVLTGEL